MRAIVVRAEKSAGRRPEDLDLPQVRTIIERGLLWASRVGPAG